jgi:cephalosporin-C deacetylase-like acetyl esterase
MTFSVIFTYSVTMLCIGLNAAKISSSIDRPDGRYSFGEKAKFTFRVFDSKGKPIRHGKLKLTLSQDGGKVLEQRTVDLSVTPVAEMQGTLTAPGFLRAAAHGKFEGKYKGAIAGAAFEPEKIQPGRPAPADFDLFWKQEIAEADKIPLNPQIRKMPNYSTDKYSCYAVSFSAPGGKIYGFLTVPRLKHPVPCVLYVPGAGPGITHPIRNQFGNKLAVLALNVHEYDPLAGDINASYAKANQPVRYSKRNNGDKRKYFYHRVILGVNRAINYLATRPDIDAKRIGAFGSSQGGMMALIAAGINPRIRFVVANVPAMCDHHAYLAGRGPGWPRLVDPELQDTVETAGYYDVVNFARRIKVPVRIIAGFDDATSPPGSVYAAYNVIPSVDKKITGEAGMGHSSRVSYANGNTDMYSALTALEGKQKLTQTSTIIRYALVSTTTCTQT